MNIKSKPKVIILRTAGTNCDIETAYAFDKVGAQTDRVHINRLIDSSVSLKDYSILAIPGGFSYGDDIGSGKILANEIRFELQEQFRAFIRSGKIVIGICNGFQVLVKSGLLPNLTGTFDKIEATLSLNDSARYRDCWTYLKHEEKCKCIWTKNIDDLIYLPVAHAEGKFIPLNKKVLRDLNVKEQVVFRYCTKEGQIAQSFPENPSGTVESIAGICDASGRVLGLMPHPERHIEHVHHPYWTRLPKRKEGDGLKLFRNGVEYMKHI